MELIIKPTEACNFKCTFCSSTNISEEHTKKMPLKYIEEFIDRFPNTNTIIINGGDPLIMPPKYYFDIIDILDRKGCGATLSFTTNLYPFYLKPEKWTPLFNHERVGVTTSFQYGGRLKHDYTEYTEQEFWKVSDLFLEKVGYRPDFIAVMTNEIKDTWYKTIVLAKEMNVNCKLNYANASGAQVIPFTIADIYEIYVSIWDLGLEDYEYNTKQLVDTLRGKATTCPLSRHCDTGIRCLQPDGDYYSCGSFGDDKLYPIDYQKEVKEGKFFTPLADSLEVFSMKEDCFTCYNFNICNGCKKGIHDTKNNQTVEYHCQKMKSLIPRFIDIENGIRKPESVEIPKENKKQKNKVFEILSNPM